MTGEPMLSELLYLLLLLLLNLRHHPLYWPARDELSDDERHQQDAEQRRNHEQQAADGVGKHERTDPIRVALSWTPCRHRTTRFPARRARSGAWLVDDQRYPNRRSNATAYTTGEPNSARRGSAGPAHGRRW